MVWIWVLAITTVLGALYTGVLLLYALGWHKARQGMQTMPEEADNTVMVSVIVPARNEEAALPACLSSLSAQHYPAPLMEVIVVNDASEDATEQIAAAYASKDSRFQCISPQWAAGTTAHKKRAIEAGIALSKGRLILCTDADCCLPPLWLSSMVNAYAGGQYHFIAAPVAYSTLHTVLSIFQTLDFMTLQGITAASVTLRLHSMCNGANIAYTREAFDAVGGFAGIDQLPTGDDMLLMHKIYNLYPQGTRYWLKKEALVTTIPPQHWRDFFNQRIRWASKAAYYEDRRIFWVLLLVYFVNCWMLVLFVLPWLDAAYWPIMLGALLTKVVIELVFLIPVANFFEKTKWLIFFPLMQPLHIIYTVLAGWLGFAGSYNWKGRTTMRGTTPV